MKPTYPLFLAVLALAATFAGVSRAADTRPNVIFILADDLGYGDLGCYGQPRIKTPALDRMAADGVRFTQFYAGSTVCAPSRCVLLTGQHVGHGRIRGNANVALEPGDVTVAEMLKGAGYHTGIVGKWGLGEAGSPAVPNRKGFDYFYGFLNQTHAHNYYPTFLWRNEEKVPLRNEVRPATNPAAAAVGAGIATKRVDYAHDLFAAEALSYVEKNKDNPFFLYLAFTIPHANGEAAPNGLEVPDQGQYANETWPEQEKNKAAMISRMDRDIGRLFDLLKSLSLDEKTVVFFASDNGPHKEGGINPNFFDSNGPLRGIKRDLYEGGIRVPLIVRWPGHTKPGTTSDYVGSFVDFMATAADLTGAKAPPTDGHTFLPSILGKPEEQKQHDYLYWEFYEGAGARSIRLGDWAAIHKPLAGGKTELYDLKTDLAEAHDVAADHPDVVKQAEALMDQAHTPSPHWKLPSEGGPATRQAGRRGQAGRAGTPE